MSVTHRLASAFIPTRVAVVGASDREGSRGRAVWSGVMNSRRVLEAYPVNPKYKYIGLTPCWAGLRDLPHTPELCVIATPSARVESVLKDCAALGIANVLVTPGEGTWTEDRLWQDKLAQTARERGIHLIGPDSVGIMRPDISPQRSRLPCLIMRPKPGSAFLPSSVRERRPQRDWTKSWIFSRPTPKPKSLHFKFSRCGIRGA